MGLTAAALATELKAMPLFNTEGAAIDAWTGAFSAFFGDAASNEVIVLPAALPAAETAMKAAMATVIEEEVVTFEGLSLDSANALQLGITAFWGALIPATAWATVTAITPPPLLASIGAALSAVFEANRTGSLTKDASMDAIATAIYTNNLGGLATWPGPTSIAIL